MQSKLFQNLKNKTVRDLYWLLFSEVPLSDDFDLSPYSLFPQEIINEWKNSTVDYFSELDQNATNIEKFVSRKKNNRLGFYAEALLSYFFQTFQEIELLLQNFQVIIDKRTMGEIDFIILYKAKVIHLECSVKYYILKNTEDYNNESQWVGPRIKDNLQLKLDKTIQNQIPLGKKREVLEKISRPIDISCLFIKGVFFAEDAIAPGRINRNIPTPFIRISKLNKLDSFPVEILSRPNWLSSLTQVNNPESKDIPKIDQELEQPLLCMFSDGCARFIVSDNWGL